MQGHFQKNFRRRRMAAGWGGAGPEAGRRKGPPTARSRPRGGPRGRRHRRRPPFRRPPGRPTGRPPRKPPIYYVRAASPDHSALDKIKTAGRRPAVYRNRGYDRGVRPKRSRWAGSVAAAPRTADLGRPKAARRPLIDRFPANCTGRQLVTPFPQSFEPWFCIYSVILSASKDFARLHQAAQRR